MSIDFLGSLIGGGLSYLGQRQASKDALEAAQQQAAAVQAAATGALEQAQPYGVGGLGGTAQFDADSRTALLNLSPELANIYGGALTRSGLFGGQAGQYAGMDPFAAGELFYQQQQPYFQEEEDRQRTNLETRLLAQGRLGGTGGAQEQRALEESIGASQAQRRTAGFNRAQALINTLLGRERGDLATATGLLDIPLQYANVGSGIGGTLGQVAASGLASQAASQGLLAAVQGTGNPLTSGLMGAGGYITKNFGYQRPKQAGT